MLSGCQRHCAVNRRIFWRKNKNCDIVGKLYPHHPRHNTSSGGTTFHNLSKSRNTNVWHSIISGWWIGSCAVIAWSNINAADCINRYPNRITDIFEEIKSARRQSFFAVGCKNMSCRHICGTKLFGFYGIFYRMDRGSDNLEELLIIVSAFWHTCGYIAGYIFFDISFKDWQWQMYIRMLKLHCYIY